MLSTSKAYARSAVLAFFLIGAGAGTVGAQQGSWGRLIAAADSIGPETPAVTPARTVACGAGVQLADSVQVSGGSAREFLFASRSLRTRGNFSHPVLPSSGSGRFALREIQCDETGRPFTFVLERDHRYFYLIFSLRDLPTFQGVTFFTDAGGWSCFRWEASTGSFAPAGCRPVAGSKC